MRRQKCAQCGTMLDISKLQSGSKFACASCGAILVVGEATAVKKSLKESGPAFTPRDKAVAPAPAPGRRRAAEPSAERPSRRGAEGATRKSKMPLFIGVGVVAVVAVVAVVLAVLLFSGGGGRKPDETTTTTTTEPVTPSPAPPPVEEKPVVKLPADKQLERDLKDLLEQARREETTGNYQEALSLYQRVLVKAPADSPYAAQAKGAADLVRDRLQVEKGIKRPERKFITARQSEEAGKEFEERKAEFWRRLGDFDVEKVKADAQALLDRTREGAPERAAIEETLSKMRYVESLLGIVQARAASISGEKSKWTRYDPMADREFTVMSASAKGVDLRDDETGETRTKPWTEIPALVRVSFLEALRNPVSGTETLWLGAYCLLIGEGPADRYFDFALDLDPSPQMRAEVSALRGGK